MVLEAQEGNPVPRIVQWQDKVDLPKLYREGCQSLPRMLMLDMEQLEEYDKWFAYYDDRMYFPYAHKIWQYTSTGRVSGIAGDVDLNISFEELKDE